VEPCVFGGEPDCSQCGCAISTALHGLRDVKVAGPVTISHLLDSSIAVGSVVNRLRARNSKPARWQPGRAGRPREGLVQISS